ncbi:hypothetical protein BD413DRAFT_113287 [Trametes elegans]|nr:hypothetical protein BD413DRAFT_113287 [Trametes elegans]
MGVRTDVLWQCLLRKVCILPFSTIRRPGPPRLKRGKRKICKHGRPLPATPYFTHLIPNIDRISLPSLLRRCYEILLGESVCKNHVTAPPPHQRQDWRRHKRCRLRGGTRLLGRVPAQSESSPLPRRRGRAAHHLHAVQRDTRSIRALPKTTCGH